MDRVRFVLLGLGCLAIGCGDNSPAVVLDVTFDGTAVQQFLAYREDSGDWQVPKMTSSTVTNGRGDISYDLPVLDPYEVVSVCVASDETFHVQHLFGTRADGEAVLACDVPFAVPVQPPVLFDVDGKVDQPGQVFMWGEAEGQDAPWMFNVHVPPGTHDLIAIGHVDGAQRILIGRDQVVSGNMTEPTIDLASDGAGLVNVGMSLSGVDGDELFTFGGLWTTDGYASLPVTTSPGMTVSIAPESLLRDGEIQQLLVQADPPPPPPPPLDQPPTPATQIFSRDVWATLSESGPTSLALLPKLSGFTYDVATSPDGVTVGPWGTVPISDYRSLDITLGDMDRNWESAIVSRSWLEATAATSLTLDTSAPGYDATWKLDTSQGYESCFDVADGDGTSTSSETSRCDAHPASAARAVDLAALHRVSIERLARMGRHAR